MHDTSSAVADIATAVAALSSAAWKTIPNIASTAEPQSTNAQNTVRNTTETIGNRLHSNILAGGKFVNSTLKEMVTFGKQNSANSRATVGKRRNHKQKIIDVHKLLRHLDVDAAFGKQNSANSRATFDKRRNYKREIINCTQIAPTSARRRRNSTPLLNSTLEVAASGKPTSANSRSTFDKRRNYKREIMNCTQIAPTSARRRGNSTP